MERRAAAGEVQGVNLEHCHGWEQSESEVFLFLRAHCHIHTAIMCPENPILVWRPLYTQQLKAVISQDRFAPRYRQAVVHGCADVC